MKLNRNWTNKQEYLAFVAEWKVLYKQLSAAIRANRRGERAMMSLCHFGTKYLPLTLEEAEKMAAESAKTLNAIRSEVFPNLAPGEEFRYPPREVATFLLEMRKEEKQRAAQAREAALAQFS